jgi:hypothetical protein
MKKVIICISVVALLLLLLPINLAVQKYRFAHLDHKRILDACRQAITDRKSYRNDKGQWGTLHEDDILLLPPMQDNVPQELRDLHPSYILIREDSVLITFNVPLVRLSILGFASGARQYGTSQYIDGLWFWNGDDSTKRQ